jgi:hypothetical protein
MMDEQCRRIVEFLFKVLIHQTGFNVRNISDKYIIVRDIVSGQEYRIDVTPHIDTTEVVEAK